MVAGGEGEDHNQHFCGIHIFATQPDEQVLLLNTIHACSAITGRAVQHTGVVAVGLQSLLLGGPLLVGHVGRTE